MELLLILAVPFVALLALAICAPSLFKRKSTRRGVAALCGLMAFGLAAAAGWIPLEALLLAGGLGAAVSANQVIKRQGTERGTGPIYQSTTLYEGTFCFINSTGYVTGDTDSGASMFAGIAVEEYDNSAGSSGDLDAEWFAEGIFELTGSGFGQDDVGKEVFASNNYDITLTDSSSAVPIGVVHEYVSATVIRVKITGLPQVPGVTSNVLAFTGSTGANEIRVPIVFVTTDAGEKIAVAEATEFSDNVTLSGAVDLIFSGTTGQPEILLSNNLADALSIKDGTGDLLVFTTTTGALAINSAARFSATGNTANTAGAGITGAAASFVATVCKFGTLIKTTIVVDLTGLNSGGSADDIIGDEGVANCHLGQITAAVNGTIIAGKLTCLETPATGDDDIDVYSATEDSGTEDAGIGALTETQLCNSGDLTAGSVVALTAPAADQYLYLVAGTGDSNATYTAGILMLEFWGKAA